MVWIDDDLYHPRPATRIMDKGISRGGLFILGMVAGVILMLATLLLSCFIVFAADRPPTFDQRFGALPKSNMEPVIRMQHHFAPAGWPHNYRLA